MRKILSGVAVFALAAVLAGCASMEGAGGAAGQSAPAATLDRIKATIQNALPPENLAAETPNPVEETETHDSKTA